MVWSPELQFQIKGRSIRRLLRYLTFKIFRSSSIGRHRNFMLFQFWFGHLILSFKFEEDPISSCWDIQLLIFWGRLSLVVVFVSIIFYFVWSPKLKFKIWGKSDQWLLRYSTFNILRSSSILLLVVVFLSSFLLILVWSPELKFQIWGRSGQWLLRYSTFWGLLLLEVLFHWRSSSFRIFK